MNENLNTKNKKLALKLAVFTIGMFGFGYALVPLYDRLCCWAGLNGKQCTVYSKQISFEKVDTTRSINVQFLSSINDVTPMVFYAETPELKVHPGESYTVNFYARNNSDHEIIAHANPSFTPGLTADYFRKIQCFCFTEQKFKPKETKTMPVQFVVSADLPEQYNTITLSYTFFDNTDKSVK